MSAVAQVPYGRCTPTPEPTPDLRADSATFGFTEAQRVATQWSGFGIDVVDCDFYAWAPAPNDPAVVGAQLPALLAGHPLLRQVAGLPLDSVFQARHPHRRREMQAYTHSGGALCRRTPRIVVFADPAPADYERWKRLIEEAAQAAAARVFVEPTRQPDPSRAGHALRSRVSAWVLSHAEAVRLQREIDRRVEAGCLPPGAVAIDVGTTRQL